MNRNILFSKIIPNDILDWREKIILFKTNYYYYMFFRRNIHNILELTYIDESCLTTFHFLKKLTDVKPP